MHFAVTPRCTQQAGQDDVQLTGCMACLLQEAGIPKKLAPTIGISVDHRRRNRSLESLQVCSSNTLTEQASCLQQLNKVHVNRNVWGGTQECFALTAQLCRGVVAFILVWNIVCSAAMPLTAVGECEPVEGIQE